MQALLDINDYFVDELSVRTNHDFSKKDQSSGEIKVDFDIKRNNTSPLEFMIPMTIAVNNNESSFAVAEYQISLKITGFFGFAEGADEETVNRMIGPSGLAILYGVARGVVAQATGNCWHGKFILPSMNFVEMLRDKASSEPAPVKRKKKAIAP